MGVGVFSVYCTEQEVVHPRTSRKQTEMTFAQGPFSSDLLPPACFNLLIIPEPPMAPAAWTQSPEHEPFGKTPPLPTRLIILFGNQRLSSV